MSIAGEVVLDASLTLAWALPDEASAYSDGMLQQIAAGKAWVPAIWPHEIANGLLMAQKRGRFTAAQRVAFIEELLRLPIEVEHRSARSVLDTHVALAEQYALTAYDAAYLDLALRKGVPLASQDKALKAAAKKAGVKLAIT
ncbi:MAG: type II toxin-antitoxin system VapC family toxin [Ilumatobacteraceae bacterium]